jgi:hypothetical protein
LEVDVFLPQIDLTEIKGVVYQLAAASRYIYDIYIYSCLPMIDDLPMKNGIFPE